MAENLRPRPPPSRPSPQANSNPKARFHVVKGCTHFSILRPASELVAATMRDGSFAALLARDSFELTCG
jgi:hypothetical protein